VRETKATPAGEERGTARAGVRHRIIDDATNVPLLLAEDAAFENLQTIPAVYSITCMSKYQTFERRRERARAWFNTAHLE